MDSEWQRITKSSNTENCKAQISTFCQTRYDFLLIICTLTGIADSGSGVGILVFAPLTTVLLEAYGWKGTHLVFGGLTLGSILFASLMGPIVSKCQPNLKEENKQVYKK